MQDPTAMVKQLEREVRTLKQELSMHDTLNNRANQNYDAITDAQMAEIQRQVSLSIYTHQASILDIFRDFPNKFYIDQ